MYPFRHFFRRFTIVTVSAPNIPDSALKVTVSALLKKLYVNTCPNGTLNYKLVKIGNFFNLVPKWLLFNSLGSETVRAGAETVRTSKINLT